MADSAKLAFIIGAFMAGISIGRSRQHERIARDLGAVGNILIPVFFAQIGISADLSAMVKPQVLGIAAVLTVVAVAGKMAAALGAFGIRVDRVLIGLGMVPRGEVGLIFASIGLSNGVLGDDQYGALLIVVLLTTILTPPMLRWRLGQTGAAATDDAEVTPEPPGGWLSVARGEIVLDGTPPVSATVPLAPTGVAATTRRTTYSTCTSPRTPPSCATSPSRSAHRSVTSSPSGTSPSTRVTTRVSTV